MLYEAIKRAQETGVKIPRQDIVALLATCLMHDSVEDWVIKDEHYKLDPNVDVISPLLISRVLRKTGLRGSRPNYVATAVRLMMHEKGQPWMHTYEEYIPRPSSNFLSAIVKPSGDVLHNYQADRLPEPQQRDGETQEKFAERLKDYKSKQRHLASILFGDRMINAPNSKNAYHHDKRAVAYARPILYSARGIIEREGDRAKYPHVDWGRAVPIEKLKSEAMPELVETLQSDFQMPKTTL